jgi:hypothetical protein
VAAIREVEIPVTPDPDTLRALSWNGVKGMTRKKSLHAGKAGPRGGHSQKGEDVIDAAAVGFRPNQAGRKKCFDLGSEQQPGSANAPVEWHDADSVTRQHQAVATVPQGEAERTVEAMADIAAVLVPKMNEQFSLAGHVQAAWAPAEQIFAEVGMVVEPPVADGGDHAISTAKRTVRLG